MKMKTTSSRAEDDSAQNSTPSNILDLEYSGFFFFFLINAGNSFMYSYICQAS